MSREGMRVDTGERFSWSKPMTWQETVMTWLGYAMGFITGGVLVFLLFGR
jgi:hypothetical protein